MALFEVDEEKEEKDGIVNIGQITDEVFLEVKVPFTAVMELVLYLKNFIKQMNSFEWNETKFGPVHEKLLENGSNHE